LLTEKSESGHFRGRLQDAESTVPPIAMFVVALPAALPTVRRAIRIDPAALLRSE
jgi:hypothetical protein